MSVTSTTGRIKDAEFDFARQPAGDGVDAFTRECLALEADTSLGSRRVTRVFDRLIEGRGRPENVRSDNDPELTSRRMLA